MISYYSVFKIRTGNSNELSIAFLERNMKGEIHQSDSWLSITKGSPSVEPSLGIWRKFRNKNMCGWYKRDSEKYTREYK